MKLCPPASSSDVELARAIAQRLSQSPASEAGSDAPGYLSFARHDPAPPPPLEPDRQPEPSAPEPDLPEAEAEGLPDVEVDVSDAGTPDIPLEPEPFAAAEPDPFAVAEPDPFAVAEPDPFAAAEPDPFAAAEPAAEPEPFGEPQLFGQPEPASPEEPGPFDPEPFAEAEPSADPLADLPGVLPGLAPDDPLADLTGPAAPEATAAEFDPLAALAESPEVLPSWSEILETCQRLAEARGAMLVAADGMVVESQGDWPQAGAQAVADKLVPIVEKKHQASPGAAVSLRLGPSILTAWKVRIGNAEPMAAFVADRAVAPVVRPEIEDQLKRGELD